MPQALNGSCRKEVWLCQFVERVLTGTGESNYDCCTVQTVTGSPTGH